MQRLWLFFSFSSLTYDPSSRFRSTPPLPNLFCHVTPLIGWHVINSLACTAGCHLHGNKSLPLNVGGGKRTRLCASLQQTSPSHPYQLSYSNLLGRRSVIFVSRWQTVLIEYCGSFLWMLLMGELRQIKFFWWLTSINPTVHLGPLFICPYKPSVIHYWVISFWTLYHLQAHLSWRSLALAQLLLVYSVSAKAATTGPSQTGCVLRDIYCRRVYIWLPGCTCAQ